MLSTGGNLGRKRFERVRHAAAGWRIECELCVRGHREGFTVGTEVVL